MKCKSCDIDLLLLEDFIHISNTVAYSVYCSGCKQYVVHQLENDFVLPWSEIRKLGYRLARVKMK